jgi:hypothetical protein
LREEDEFVVEGMSQRTSGFDAKMILVLTQAERPSDYSEFNRIIGMCLCVFGGFCLVPLGVWTLRHWRKPKAEKSDSFAPH